MGKILISGTGRCGTTFLIKLFTFLGFNTGFNKNNYDNYIFTNCNSGMEKNYNETNYILKNPNFIEKIDDIIMDNIKIKYMIIPIRDYIESAQSRLNHGNDNGGLWQATNIENQVEFYNKIMANYLYSMVKYDINTIFLDFNMMISNSMYLYNKLKIILDEENISFEDFDINYIIASKSSKP